MNVNTRVNISLHFFDCKAHFYVVFVLLFFVPWLIASCFFHELSLICSIGFCFLLFVFFLFFTVLVLQLSDHAFFFHLNTQIRYRSTANTIAVFPVCIRIRFGDAALLWPTTRGKKNPTRFNLIAFCYSRMNPRPREVSMARLLFVVTAAATATVDCHNYHDIGLTGWLSG